MLREKLRCDGLARHFPGSRLGAVLAKLERMRVCGLGPGAAHTHESAGLILLEQNFAAEDGDLLLCQDVNDGAERSPAAGRSIIFFDLCFLPHGGPLAGSPEGKPVEVSQVPGCSEPCRGSRVDTPSKESSHAWFEIRRTRSPDGSQPAQPAGCARDIPYARTNRPCCRRLG